MNRLTKPQWRIAEVVIIVACLSGLGYVLYDAAADGARDRHETARNRDKARRFDRVCTDIVAPLRLARLRVETVGSVEAGRDIAVIIAPVVGQCSGIPAYQGRLEALATSNDAARDAAVIQGILDEITGAP